MKVFLTGGTGFVGGEILRQLKAAGHQVVALVRPGSEGKLGFGQGVEIRPGDVTEPASLKGALAGCDAVVHLVGIIREFPARGITFERLHHEATANVLREAQAQGVKRYLHMSSNGVREGAETGYLRSKWQAEQEVRRSGLDWTIFRPSVIFGPGDDFVNMIADLMRKLPIFPVIGNGKYRLAPVAVENVAAGFLGALQRPETAGHAYHCCGPREFTYDELLDAIGEAIGKERVRKVHHPVALVKPVVAVMEKRADFPITGEQLAMLLAGNVCDPREWRDTFDIAMVELRDGLRRMFAA